jgi:hypothetical protein
MQKGYNPTSRTPSPDQDMLELTKLYSRLRLQVVEIDNEHLN